MVPWGATTTAVRGGGNNPRLSLAPRLPAYDDRSHHHHHTQQQWFENSEDDVEDASSTTTSSDEMTWCSAPSSSPRVSIGAWVIEAGPADGNWASFDQMLILSASANASSYMLGQDVELAGFALHPNPADTFHAGNQKDWEHRVAVPAAARETRGAVGVRWRPFGGADDGGELAWIAGVLVAKSADCMTFLCVDLVAHGPLTDDSVRALGDLGAFDRYCSVGEYDNKDPSMEDSPSLTQQQHTRYAVDATARVQPPPSPAACARQLDEHDQVRALADEGARDRPLAEGEWTRDQWHCIRRRNCCDLRALRDRCRSPDSIEEAKTAPPPRDDNDPSSSPPRYGVSVRVVAAVHHYHHQDGKEYDIDDIDPRDSESCDSASLPPSSPVPAPHGGVRASTSRDAMENLGDDLERMDLDADEDWAMLRGGSRVL